MCCRRILDWWLSPTVGDQPDNISWVEGERIVLVHYSMFLFTNYILLWNNVVTLQAPQFVQTMHWRMMSFLMTPFHSTALWRTANKRLISLRWIIKYHINSFHSTDGIFRHLRHNFPCFDGIFRQSVFLRLWVLLWIF